MGIQKGNKARKDVADKKEKKEQDEAAEKIQAIQKGNKARKDVATKKDTKQGAAGAPAKGAAKASQPNYAQVTVNEFGCVGIWTKQPQTMVHLHSDDAERPAVIHASGSTAGLSF